MTKVAHTQHDDPSKTSLGFWIYLMTDCVLFASLFAVFAVLRNNTADGPSGAELFDLQFIFIETVLLLASSFTAGLSILAARSGKLKQVIFWLAVTFALGLAFLLMEIYEFSHLIHEGYSWRESGFLSAYFTLVGTHGLHIFAGLLWISAMVGQLLSSGLTAGAHKRLGLFSMFWHFLDIVWIFIFTFVYLMAGVSL